MSLKQATQFIREIAADEEKRAHVMHFTSQLNVGGLHTYAADLGYEFTTDEFIVAYKQWYEQLVHNAVGHLSKEDIADLLVGSSKGGPVYAAGVYTKPPYRDSKAPYLAATKDDEMRPY